MVYVATYVFSRTYFLSTREAGEFHGNKDAVRMTLKKERRPYSPRLVALRLHGGMAVEQEVCNFRGLNPNTSATSKQVHNGSSERLSCILSYPNPALLSIPWPIQ